MISYLVITQQGETGVLSRAVLMEGRPIFILAKLNLADGRDDVCERDRRKSWDIVGRASVYCISLRFGKIAVNAHMPSKTASGS